MSQVENHIKWCLNDPNRLKISKPNKDLALKHLEKSEYNSQVLRDLEKLKRFDWALNVGFYSIYHCFLAILAYYGYESRNQSCTVSVILNLVDSGKINLDRSLVLLFDTLDVEKEAASSTIRHSREMSTYGVSSSIDNSKLDEIKEIIKKVQIETIKIINN